MVNTFSGANGLMNGDSVEDGALNQLIGQSITYRITVGTHQGCKVLTLQTLPNCNEPFDDRVGKVAGFLLHAGATAHERKKLERLCRLSQGPRCRSGLRVLHGDHATQC